MSKFKEKDTIEQPDIFEEESAEYRDETELGSIKIPDSVVAVCAVNATLKTQGVAGLTSRLVDSLSTHVLGKESLSKGVKIDHEDKGINIDLFVIVKYGFKIPEVAWDIQTNVKKEVENMTDKKVLRVDIHVQGVI